MINILKAAEQAKNKRHKEERAQRKNDSDRQKALSKSLETFRKEVFKVVKQIRGKRFKVVKTASGTLYNGEIADLFQGERRIARFYAQRHSVEAYHDGDMGWIDGYTYLAASMFEYPLYNQPRQRIFIQEGNSNWKTELENGIVSFLSEYV